MHNKPEGLTDWRRTARIIVAALACASPLLSGTMVVTYSPAGEMGPVASRLCTAGADCYIQETTFNDATTNPTTILNNDSFTGSFGVSFSGYYSILSADKYGGADGTYKYISAANGSHNKFTVTFSPSGIPGVDYFGLWFSALDGGNEMVFHFSDGTPDFTFNAQSFINLVGTCPNAFCGNPSTRFSGQDGDEQFAFLNFFFEGSGYITSIDFEQTSGSGSFESDNYTLAYMDPVVSSGTVIESATPEPGTMALAALAGLGLLAGRKLRARRLTASKRS